MTVDIRVKHAFHMLSLHYNIMIDNADFEKRRYLVKCRFLYLISKQFISNLKLEPFEEVCGGCPLQFVAEHLSLKSKIKKVIAKN